MRNVLTVHPDLRVGDCVPFYFCPRSVMLYLIYKANSPELEYQGGQDAIIHLEASLKEAVNWSDREKRRWAFTTSNAGSRYFDDYSDESQLGKINWSAVRAVDWRECKEGKQAEFLVEHSFPWKLVRQVGALSAETRRQALAVLRAASHRPCVARRENWYY